jgi:hypothetical protein
MVTKRIIATFHPQAWIRDYAVFVDPEGETDFDVTDVILAMPREKALALEDDQYDSDRLREAPNAPAWIKNWSGPFYIEVEQSIADYFASEPAPRSGGG